MMSIYAILLYLQQIFCGSSYTQDQMNAISAANQTQITSIQQNQQMMDQIHHDYDNSAQQIVATNPDLNP